MESRNLEVISMLHPTARHMCDSPSPRSSLIYRRLIFFVGVTLDVTTHSRPNGL